MVFRIAIAGSGLTGLTLASYLYKHELKAGDLEIKVLCKTDSYNHHSDGWQAAIGPVGIKALESALLNYHKKCMQAKTEKFLEYNRILHVDHATFLNFEDTTSENDANLKIATDRPGVREMLYKNVESYADTLIPKKIFESFDIADDGAVIVHFEDGTTHVADLLVDAIGASSPIASQLGLRNRHDESWFVITGGGPMKRPILAAEFTPREHLEEIPLDRGSVFAKDEKGVTGFFNRLNNDDYPNGMAYFALTFPKLLIPDHLSNWLNQISWKPSTNEWKSFIVKYMKDNNWSSLIWPLIEVSHEVNVARAGECDPLPENWRALLQDRSSTSAEGRRLGSPRIWVLGDAVAQMPQYFGQGVNNALADAVSAGSEIIKLAIAVQVPRNIRDRELLFAKHCARYETERFPVAFRSAQHARQRSEETIKTKSPTRHPSMAEMVDGQSEWPASYEAPEGHLTPVYRTKTWDWQSGGKAFGLNEFGEWRDREGRLVNSKGELIDPEAASGDIPWANVNFARESGKRAENAIPERKIVSENDIASDSSASGFRTRRQPTIVGGPSIEAIEAIQNRLHQLQREGVNSSGTESEGLFINAEAVNNPRVSEERAILVDSDYAAEDEASERSQPEAIEPRTSERLRRPLYQLGSGSNSGSGNGSEGLVTNARADGGARRLGEGSSTSEGQGAALNEVSTGQQHETNLGQPSTSDQQGRESFSNSRRRAESFFALESNGSPSDYVSAAEQQEVMSRAFLRDEQQEADSNEVPVVHQQQADRGYVLHMERVNVATQTLAEIVEDVNAGRRRVIGLNNNDNPDALPL